MLKQIKMFIPARENKLKTTIINENECGMAVETIMKCDDFKSNFARRLSNRYVVKPSDEHNKTEHLHCKLLLKGSELEATTESAAETETINTDGETASSTPRQNVTHANIDSTMHLLIHGTPRKENILCTEVAALNSEVEILRWQLKQTEANRQMHIALLEQVVNFLNRVRDHMVAQKVEESERATISTKILKTSFKSSELPRSRSVFHMNKTVDYSLEPAKKFSSNKMSKSILNVNGFHKDYVPNGRHENVLKDVTWKQSKMSLHEDSKSNQKIIEDLSRIINLANTVLTTKLPDLSCCSQVQNTQEGGIHRKCTTISETNTPEFQTEDNKTIPEKVEAKIKEYSFQNAFVLNTSSEGSAGFEGITNEFIENRDRDKYVISSSPLTCGLEDDFASSNIDGKSDRFSSNVTQPTGSKNVPNRRTIEKKSDLNAFVEDESGFSSMSSFQEIGIPIINVIPPTPSKDIAFLSESDNPEIGTGVETWKSEQIGMDKHPMKVFWV